jgi:hypothetical protein
MIVFALLLFEHGFASYEFTDAQVPDVYRVIKEDKGDYAILEVPIPPVEYHIENGVWTYSIPEVEYYQTLHGKKIVGGYVERQPPEALEFIDTKSPFCQLRNIFSGMKKRECLSTPTIGQLREHNIRFVVVHRELIKMFPYSDNETMSRVDGVINEIFGDLRPFYDDGSIVAYRIE